MFGRGITESQLMIDTTDAHPLRYLSLVGVEPEHSFGFVPLHVAEQPSHWAMVYRETPRTAAGRAQPGSVGAPPALVVDRLYPRLKLIQASQRHPLSHYLSIYRDQVGLRAADTYGVLPIHARMSQSSQDLEFVEWHVVYRARPEYAERRHRYAEKLRERDWPQAVELGEDHTAPPIAPADRGRVHTSYQYYTHFEMVTPDPAKVPGHLQALVLGVGRPPEQVYAVAAGQTHREARMSYLR